MVASKLNVYISLFGTKHVYTAQCYLYPSLTQQFHNVFHKYS